LRHKKAENADERGAAGAYCVKGEAVNEGRSCVCGASLNKKTGEIRREDFLAECFDEAGCFQGLSLGQDKRGILKWIWPVRFNRIRWKSRRTVIGLVWIGFLDLGSSLFSRSFRVLSVMPKSSPSSLHVEI
jgi:hypothetical protein